MSNGDFNDGNGDRDGDREGNGTTGMDDTAGESSGFGVCEGESEADTTLGGDWSIGFGRPRRRRRRPSLFHMLDSFELDCFARCLVVVCEEEPADLTLIMTKDKVMIRKTVGINEGIRFVCVVCVCLRLFLVTIVVYFTNEKWS